MKKPFAVAIALSCSLLLTGTLKTDENIEPVFGLLIVDDFQLDPACKYSNGTFEDLSIYPDSSEPHPEFILHKVKDFLIFRKGAELGKFTVTKIEKGGLNCYGFLAGYGKYDIPDSIFDTVRYPKTDFLPALSLGSKAIKTQKRSVPLKLTLSPKQQGKLLEIARQKFLEQKLDPKILKDLKIETSLSYDLNGDRVVEHFMKTSVEVPEIHQYSDGRTDSFTTTKTALIWAKIEKENVSQIFISSKKENFEFWKEAWNLVDFLDIDGDSIPEASFEAYGEPEYSYFQIYQFTKEGFQLVYVGARSGC